MAAPTGKRDWLKTKHPVYETRFTEWMRNERRLAGGVEVLTELRRYDWETCVADGYGEFSQTLDAEAAEQGQLVKDKLGASLNKFAPGEHYAMRQSQAVYMNFPEDFSGMLAGHLFKKRPTVDKGLSFGSLGKVRPERNQQAPNNAELVYYNADGVGNDGSQWDSFWADVTRWSAATGHRWLFVEASTTPGITQEDVNNGKRPYLLHLSPLEVTNWDFHEGRLAWAVHTLPMAPATVSKDGKLDRKAGIRRRLYVRAGFTGLQDAELDFSKGGWWTFDKDGNLLNEPGAVGQWDKTKGDIPMWAHYYERDRKRMSRAGTTEIGNAAVAYMNLDSAASYDAWDASASLQFFLGVDPASFQVAMDKVQAGSKYVPVPASGEPGTNKIVPSVQDSSAGAVSADVFAKRLLAIRDAVKELTGREVSGTPNSSGASKEAGFGEGKAPRLALLASEVETSQNIALHYLELRFGVSSTPQGSVQWTRDFELAPVMDSIERLFELQKSSGIASPTLSTKLMMTAVKESGALIDGKDQGTVESEFQAAGEALVNETQRMATINSEFGRDGSTPPADNGGVPVPPSGVEHTSPDTVLNGAQVTAAVEIVTLVAKKELPRDSGIQMLIVFFNISEDQATAIMGDAGDGFEPTKPEPVVPPGGVVPPTPDDPAAPPPAVPPKPVA